MKKTSELKKTIALLEQRIDLQQRHIDTLEGQLDEKGDSGKVKSQEIQELMGIIKDLKKENKQVRAKQDAGIVQQLEQAKKENLNLEKIIKNEQTQYIKLHEKLLATEKKLGKGPKQQVFEPTKIEEVQQQL